MPGRNKRIDMLRGLAVFLMVWGHAVQYLSSGDVHIFENSAFRFIYSFYMPLFMIISGYVYGLGFERHTVKEIILKRMTRIVYPCVLWASLSHWFAQGLNMVQGETTFISAVKGWPAVLTGHWFLWAVAACSFMLLPYKRLTGWGFVVLQIPLLFLFRYLPTGNTTLFMYPYFVCGFFAGHADTKKCAVPIRLGTAVLALMFPVLLLHFRTEHFIYETGVWLTGMQGGFRQIGIDVFRWLIGFSGIAFVIVTGGALLGACGAAFEKTKSLFAWMGQVSLEIYLVQGFLFVQAAVRILYHIPIKFVRLSGGEEMFTYLFCPAAALLVIGLIGVFVWLLDKNRTLRRILMGG